MIPCLSTIMQGFVMIGKSFSGGYCFCKEASASLAALVPEFLGFLESLSAYRVTSHGISTAHYLKI
jgi:hypothetical protein